MARDKSEPISHGFHEKPVEGRQGFPQGKRCGVKATDACGALLLGPLADVAPCAGQ